MPRAICYCEPASALAGEINTWTFVFTPSTNLPKGTRLRFDMLSQGRGIDWETPSASTKAKANVIYLKLGNGKMVAATEVKNPRSFVPFFDFILPTPSEAGTPILIFMGAPPGDRNKTKNGTRAQCNSQRRRPFHLYVDPTGKTNFGETEVFSLDIRGSVLSTIRVLCPSFVVRNKRFDVVVRFEDEYGNLTNNAPENTLIDISHENQRENLNWKIFVPETGFITLPNLYFNEIGVYTLRLRNSKTKEVYTSPPIRCFNENNKQLFWGLLHGESDRYDSTENVENCLRHFRDDKALNFYSVSPFESQEETPNETWKVISQNVADFDEVDRFVTFLGFQWSGVSPQEGTRVMVYLKDGKQILRKKDAKYNTLKKLYKTLSNKELISIPSFSMGKGLGYNFDDFNPEFERVVEIYNAWGSSECSAKEGNSRPISNPKKTGVQESIDGAIQKALQRNLRFGFVGGGLDDRGIYSNFYEGDQVQYSPGLTGIIAPEYSRSSIGEALYNRSCYATTGERIIVGLYLSGAPMGSEVSSALKPGLLINRHLSGYVAGTTELESVELIRNGKVIHEFDVKGYSLDFTYDDMTQLEKVCINNQDKKPPFSYYYLRVTQKDGHMAWSSPIWVDLLPPSKEARRVKSTKTTSKTILPPEDELDDDEDDFDDE